MKRKIILLFLLIINLGLSQESQSSFEFLPSKFLYIPNFASNLEAKFGFEFSLNSKNLMLNVGSAKDIVHYSINENNDLGLGVEFFNWSLLRSEPDFKFPVIAIDYFFGVYFTNMYRITESFNVRNRFRLSHISAHLSDGNYDNRTSNWKDNLIPFVYSREFIEFNSSLIYKSLKIFAGLTYLYHTQPDIPGKYILHLGTQFDIIKLEKLNAVLFTSLDSKFYKDYSSKWQNDFSFLFGLNFANKYVNNFIVYFNYYKGINVNGLFSYNQLEKSILGFSFTL